MRFKSLLAVNTLAGVVVASTFNESGRQNANSFIQAERPIALQGVLNNFGPDGNLSHGAAPGIPIAGNSEFNPPCMSPIPASRLQQSSLCS
jgi:glucoamylase